MHVCRALTLFLSVSVLWPAAVVQAQTSTPFSQPATALAEGREAYRAGDYPQAVSLLLQALQIQDSPEIYYFLGLSYYNLSYFQLAIEAFDAALARYLELPPVDLLFSLGFSHYYAGNLEAAQEYFNRVLEDPRTPAELRQLAESQLLIALRDQSEAYQIGIEAFRQGDYALALQAFEEVLHLMPDSAELYYYLGISAYQQMAIDSALRYLEKVVALDPDSEYGQSAAQTLEVLEKLARNLPRGPFFGSLSLGALGDSNVNYGDTGSSFVTASQLDPAIQDLGGMLNLNLNYTLSPVSSLRYNYLLNLYSGLNDSAERVLNSYDYNLQQHNLSLFHRIPVMDWIELYLDTHSSLQMLAGEPFFAEAGLRPTLTLYETERLVTRMLANISTERYTRFSERDNWNYSLGLEQYIYLWNSESWLRFGYRFLQVMARDNLRTQQQESGGTLFETEFLAASSRSQNQLGLGLGFPLGDARLELGSQIDFARYNNPDLYRVYRRNLNPLTGLPLPREELKDLSTLKQREDTRLIFYLNLEWPLSREWSLIGRYNRITNVSNISPREIPTLTSRSYLKDMLDISLRYHF
ncbi:MAG: tetratricopeptide repeat protein [Candidatus Sericytochromatia bacterium]|nr:tetratricopeptide repeat protein [Candidatus Sericytochromatia bacterium]